MRNFLVKTLSTINTLKNAGYEVCTVSALGDGGFAISVDMGFSPSDAPHWRKALVKEVKSLISIGKSNWA